MLDLPLHLEHSILDLPLHETLSLAVSEDASLPSAALRDQAPSAVDTRGVELDELGVLRTRVVVVWCPGNKHGAEGGNIGGIRWRGGGGEGWVEGQRF